MSKWLLLYQRGQNKLGFISAMRLHIVLCELFHQTLHHLCSVVSTYWPLLWEGK